MNKLFLNVIFGFLFTLFSINEIWSQIDTMYQTNEPSIGDTKLMYVCDTSTSSLEQIKGENVIWDYTQIIGVNSEKAIEIIDPATSIYHASYPTSSKCYSVPGSLSTFYNSTIDSRNSQGFVFEEQTLGVVMATFDSNEQKMVQYPFSVGNYLVDNYSGHLLFTFFNQIQNPECHGTSHATIDGKGTLLLPSGNSFSNVVRYKIVDTVFTQINMGAPIDVMFIRQQFEYYDLTNEVLPLFTFTSVAFKQVSSTLIIANQISVLSSVKPIQTASNNVLNGNILGITPNPATDYVKVKFTGGLPLSIQILDLYGKVLKEVKDVCTETTISVQEFPPGMYFFSCNSSLFSRKLIVKR
jgi:hypothetical protein